MNVRTLSSVARDRAFITGALVTGLVFGAGLVLSGMTRPDKVIGFLNPFGGAWDPSLGLVMVGAIAVHAVLFRVILRKKSPLLDEKFQIPSRKDIDKKLVLGAALFGAGWGLGGVCPGPGLVGAASLAPPSLLFVFGLVGGMTLFRFTNKG